MKTALGAALAVLAAPLAGGLVLGVNRKITAHISGQSGLSITRPFYDLIKLWSQESTYTRGHRVFFIYACLIWMLVTLILLVAGQDFLLMVFTLTFSQVAWALARLSHRSPHGCIGMRELAPMLVAEPVLLLVAFALYQQNGTFLAAGVFINPQPLMFSYPLLFLAVLVVLTIKVRQLSCTEPSNSPTDAHRELTSDLNTGFSGRDLALVELADWTETAVLLLVVFLFAAHPWWAGVLLALASYFLIVVIENIWLRISQDWLMKAGWTGGILLGFVNILVNWARL